MKKTIGGAAILALLATSAHAQIAPGTTLVGGSIGYSSQSTEGSVGFSNTNEDLSKSSQFNVGPTLGYFIAENLALGLNVGYARGKATVYEYYLPTPVGGGSAGTPVKYDEQETKSRNFSIGPLARYYVFMGDKAAFFGQLGAGYQNLRSETTSTATTPTSNSSNTLITGSGYYAQLAPGFAFFPTDKFGLEVSLQGLTYQRNTTETDFLVPSRSTDYPLKATNSSFDAGLGLSNLQLGAFFYLGR